jgi:hypothetical protein
MKNMFFSIFFLGDTLAKNSVSILCQNQIFDFVLQNPRKKIFPRVSKLPAGFLTSTAVHQFLVDNAFQRTGNGKIGIYFVCKTEGS